MDWVHETYRRLYVRVDADWLALSVLARGIGDELLKYCNDDGDLLPVDREEPGEAVARLLVAKRHEVRAIRAAVAELLARGDQAFLVVVESPNGRRLRVRNFKVAQGVDGTSEERSRDNAVAAVGAAATRQQRYRQRRIQAICEVYGDACFWCGSVDSPLGVDHLVPRSRGGGDAIENLRPSCKSCNSRKRDMTEEEFAAWLADLEDFHKRHPGIVVTRHARNVSDVTQRHPGDVTPRAPARPPVRAPAPARASRSFLSFPEEYKKEIARPPSDPERIHARVTLGGGG